MALYGVVKGKYRKIVPTNSAVGVMKSYFVWKGEGSHSR